MYLRLHDQTPHFQNLNQVFGENFFEEQNNNFPLNLHEEDKHYLFEAQIPPVKKEDVRIEYKNRLLTVSFNVCSENKEEKDEKNPRYLIQEITEGSYSRSIRLPVDIEPSKVEAKLEDGLLSIILPKKEQDIQRRIIVN